MDKTKDNNDTTSGSQSVTSLEELKNRNETTEDYDALLVRVQNGMEEFFHRPRHPAHTNRLWIYTISPTYRGCIINCSTDKVIIIGPLNAIMDENVFSSSFNNI